MPKHTKECRVCGKHYAACNSARTGSPIFNWREVACSPECGEVYLELIRESREKTNTTECVGQLSVVGEFNDEPEFGEENAAVDTCCVDYGNEPF